MCNGLDGGLKIEACSLSFLLICAHYTDGGLGVNLKKVCMGMLYARLVSYLSSITVLESVSVL